MFFHRKFSAEYTDELRLTEQALEYAENSALDESTIEVTIKNLEHPLLAFSKEFTDIFGSDLGAPKALYGTDLELEYNRPESHFSVVRAELHFDNHYVAGFVKPERPLTQMKHQSPLYIPYAKDPNGRWLDKTATTSAIPETNIIRSLGCLGLRLPMGQQPANWQEINGILQFAGLWRARSSRAVPIDLSTTVYFDVEAQGRARDPETKKYLPHDGFIRHMVTLTSELAAESLARPATCTKLHASSGQPQERPTIQSIGLVPVIYYPAMEETGYGEIPVDKPAVRHEVISRQEQLDITPELLRQQRALLMRAVS